MAVANRPIAWGVSFTSGSSISSGTTLNDVQSFSVNTGRQWAVDNYSPASCVIQSRNIAAWTTAPKLGDMIGVIYGDIDDWYSVPFLGNIKDLQIVYGNVPAMDYALITCEGPLARWGRLQFNSKVIAQALTGTQANNVALTEATLVNNFSASSNCGSTASAQTYTGNGLDYLNTLCQTEVGHMYESYEYGSPTAYPIKPRGYFIKRNYDQTVGYTFTDSPTADSQIKFENISFTSAAQNYYTQATIQALGLAQQTAGTAGYNIVQDSYDVSTAQALNHAQYLVGQYNSTAAAPYALTASFSNNRDNATRRQNFVRICDSLRFFSGSLQRVIFRGTTYNIIVEGVDITADTSETTLTVYFSQFDNNNYLILDNAIFGTLGTNATYPGNKLGF